MATDTEKTTPAGPLPTGEPTINPDNRRYWEGTAEGRIDLPRCNACGLVIWYPRSICPDCQSTDLVWETMSGKGKVYSFSITRGGVGRSWREHTPFVLAYVELDEGPRMMTNIVGCDVGEVEIDMAVTAVFDDTGEGNAIVRFTPA